MPSNRPSTGIWRETAEMIGCDIATMKAVFEVEASGDFYTSDGKLVRRFEPHHFPREHWGALGFKPGSTAPWRASLKVRTSARRRMFAIAEQIDAERAYKASSWGAPQIMGFNHALVGYATAAALVEAFEKSADEQIRAFARFVINSGLATHLRSQDWHAFASGYNGNGQAAVYAGKIESAYRRQSGGVASHNVLRVGMRGQAVRGLQESLNRVGYSITVDGVFGQETFVAVQDFQRRRNLTVDGVAGAMTQRALESEGAPRIEAPKEELTPTAEDNKMDKLIERGTAVLGSGGAVGLLTGLSERAQEILIGGLVVGGIALVVLYVLRKKT